VLPEPEYPDLVDGKFDKTIYTYVPYCAECFDDICEAEEFARTIDRRAKEMKEELREG
jgi:hypothetical protein